MPWYQPIPRLGAPQPTKTTSAWPFSAAKHEDVTLMARDDWRVTKAAVREMANEDNMIEATSFIQRAKNSNGEWGSIFGVVAERGASRFPRGARQSPNFNQSRSARDSRETEADLVVVVLVVVAACSDPMTSVKHSKTTTRNQAVSIGWLPTPAAQKKRLAVN